LKPLTQLQEDLRVAGGNHTQVRTALSRAGLKPHLTNAVARLLADPEAARDWRTWLGDPSDATAAMLDHKEFMFLVNELTDPEAELIHAILGMAPTTTSPSATAANLPPYPSSHKQLMGWAYTHGLQQFIQQAVHEVAPHLADHAEYYRSSYSKVADVLLSHASKPFREELWALVAQQSLRNDAALAALTAAEANAPPLPSHPSLAAALKRLLQERNNLRTFLGPAASQQAGVDFKIKANPVSLLVQGPGLHTGMFVDLEADPNEEVTRHVGDVTYYHTQAGCTHTLAALDATLMALWWTPKPELLAVVTDALNNPRWKRDLDALRHNLATKRRTPQSGEAAWQLAWRLKYHAALDVDLIPLKQKQKKDGSWTDGTVARPTELLEDEDALTAAEQRALVALDAAARLPVQQRAELKLKALAALQGHPRVYLEGKESRLVPVQGATLGLLLQRNAKGLMRLTPVVQGSNLPLDLDQLTLYVDLDGRRERRVAMMANDPPRVEVLTLSRAVQTVLDHLHGLNTEFPPEAAQELVELASQLEAVLPVTLPDVIKGTRQEPRPHMTVRLQPKGDVALQVELLCQPLEHGPQLTPGDGAAELHGIKDGAPVYTRRDMQGEQQRATALANALKLHRNSDDHSTFVNVLEEDAALETLLLAKDLNDPNVSMEWLGRPWTLTRGALLKDVRVAVARKRDWFGLEGSLEVDGARVELAVLLDALRNKKRAVPLGNHQFVILGEQLRARLRDVAAGTMGGVDAPHLGPAGALALQALESELQGLQGDRDFKTLMQRVEEARNLQPVVPAALKTVLRDYQKDGFKWMARLAAWGAGAVLADDMGLGKTIQALTLLDHRKNNGPALVVAPTSVCRNWETEARRFAPALRITLHRDVPEKERTTTLAALGPKDVLVTSYGLLIRHAEQLAATTFNTLVLDEAHAVKNPSSRRAAAARGLKAEFKLALTGTPLENHLGELWSLWRVVFPGLFGGWEEFRERFANPIERNGDNDRRAALGALCRPFLLRRTKAAVAPELPPRTDVTLTVELTAAERNLYEQARLAAVAKISGMVETPEHNKRFEMLSALTRLRLCACHPRLYDEKTQIPASKLARLMELLEELHEEGHRALVFSQFTSLLALVRGALDAQKLPYLYLDGQTPPDQRDTLVQRFQAGGGGDVFLISLKAGGTGLNLTAATYVIHLDPWWNPAVEDQASDRAHRIGQEKPVTVIRLVAQGTVEEQIVSMHQDKRALVAGVLEGTEGAGRLSTKELMELIQTATRGPATAEEPDEEENSPAEPTSTETAAGAPVERAPKARVVATPKQAVVPKQAGGTYPVWLGSTAEGFEAFQREFVEDLLHPKDGHNPLSEIAKGSYVRALRRFGEHLSKRKNVKEPRAEVERYVAGLRDGSIEAPKSEPTIAVPALNRLVAFLLKR